MEPRRGWLRLCGTWRRVGVVVSVARRWGTGSIGARIVLASVGVGSTSDVLLRLSVRVGIIVYRACRVR